MSIYASAGFGITLANISIVKMPEMKRSIDAALSSETIALSEIQSESSMDSSTNNFDGFSNVAFI